MHQKLRVGCTGTWVCRGHQCPHPLPWLMRKAGHGGQTGHLLLQQAAIDKVLAGRPAYAALSLSPELEVKQVGPMAAGMSPTLLTSKLIPLTLCADDLVACECVGVSPDRWWARGSGSACAALPVSGAGQRWWCCSG